MKKININLKYHNYDIFIGTNLTAKIIRYLKNYPASKIIIIADKNFHEINKESFVATLLNAAPDKTSLIRFTATEKNKTYESILNIQTKMQRKKCGRDTLVVALGGGITGDVAGFVAATYMRGIPYIQIPTTLLASVDSSVGGKTGINLNGAKNFIGAFYQPETVFIDTEFFNSLPAEEIICGLGEVAKYAFLTNKSFFNYFKNNLDKLIELNSSAIRKIVVESVLFKSAVVIKDEKESSLRKVLNLGHTFAHAFESAYKHKIKHGQAVIIGLTAALHLSKEMGLLDEKEFIKYFSPLVAFTEYIKIKNLLPEKVFGEMLSDKKNRNGKINFVLIQEIGKTLLDVECHKSKAIASIRFALQYFG